MFFRKHQFQSLIKAKLKPSRELKGWEIALLVLGAPLWLPLIIAFAAVLLSVYAVIWSVIISLYCIDLSFAVCVLGGTAAGHYICVWRKCRAVGILFRGIDCMLRNSCFTLFCIWQNFRSACFCKQALVLKTKPIFIKKEAI